MFYPSKVPGLSGPKYRKSKSPLTSPFLNVWLVFPEIELSGVIGEALQTIEPLTESWTFNCPTDLPPSHQENPLETPPVYQQGPWQPSTDEELTSILEECLKDLEQNKSANSSNNSPNPPSDLLACAVDESKLQIHSNAFETGHLDFEATCSLSSSVTSSQESLIPPDLTFNLT